jgi:hypothetical protein
LSYHGYLSIYVSLAVLYDRKSNYHEASRLLKEGLYSGLNITSNARRRTRSALSHRSALSELSANYLFAPSQKVK